MQLDDVVSSLTTGPRVEEAMRVFTRPILLSIRWLMFNRLAIIDSRWRSVRWLDRCIEAHRSSGKPHKQNLFAIIQGGLDTDLRDKCLEAMVQRKNDIPGYAVGGLSGGEEKDVFWRM